MSIIRRLSALEILDSRGRPTIKATCELGSGATASVSIPSGASTGAAEALELRDGDSARYGGLGCRTAVHHIEGPIDDALEGRQFHTQHELDELLIELDGTPAKSRLGANAILAVSLSFARAGALERGLALYRHFADILEPARAIESLPRPTVNLFSGGKHAGGQVEIQDVLLVTNVAASVDQALSMTWDVYRSAVNLIRDRYDERPLVADEGGLAPAFPSTDAMFEDAVAAIASAGYTLGSQISLCVDVAASHFFSDGSYFFNGKKLKTSDFIDEIWKWIETFPVVSVEDGLAEEDWEGWPALLHRIDKQALVLGDDLLTTNPVRIQRAIEAGAADALLLKVNQIGTLTEAAEACRLVQSAGWKVVVSARSGETEDDWLTDLAVGWGGDALKVGSLTRSERLAKWNRLLEIEADTGLPLNPWPNAQ
jgi:enolase 1/2/3